MANLKDTIVLGNLTVTSSVMASSMLYGQYFTSDGTCAMRLSGSNEMNLSATSSTLYIGYKTATGSNAVSNFVFCNGTGTTSPVGTVKAANFYASSDIRLKENITIPNIPFLDIVNTVSIKEFTWKHDDKHAKNIGVIAQELDKVIPSQYNNEFVDKTNENSWTVNDSKLVYLVIGALQEQIQINKQLEERIATLEAVVRGE